MKSMDVSNVKRVAEYDRAGFENFFEGMAGAGIAANCYLVRGTFEEVDGPRAVAALTVPVHGRHTLFLAAPLVPEAGDHFGDGCEIVYEIPVSLVELALRENPEGWSVEIYVGERETDVLGIGFDGSRPGWEEVRAGAPDTILPGQEPQETDLKGELGERYLEKHLVTEYLSTAMRLFLDVADQTGYQDDILVRGRPVWFPTASCPSLVASVPAGKGSEIGLTAEYVGRAPEPWGRNRIEILRLPRSIAERVAGLTAGSRVRMVLGNSEGAYCRIEFPEGKYQKCLGSLPRFPHSFPLPERRGTGSNRSRDERIRSPGPLPAGRRVTPADDEGTISPVLLSTDESQE